VQRTVLGSGTIPVISVSWTVVNESQQQSCFVVEPREGSRNSDGAESDKGVKCENDSSDRIVDETAPLLSPQTHAHSSKGSFSRVSRALHHQGRGLSPQPGLSAADRCAVNVRPSVAPASGKRRLFRA
jgi:hypothetical protein